MNIYPNEDLKKRIAEAEVVSFDIFDTLIHRPFLRPIDLFSQLEHSMNMPGFAKARIEAEKEARSKCPDGETSLSEIYAQLDKKYSHFEKLEENLEVKSCIRNEEIGKLYDYARNIGKTIIIVSDMYLPKRVIEKILKSCGYTHYNKLFLSNDIGFQKINTLFPFVLKEMNCQAHTVFHIGDNHIGDVEIPDSFGISTHHFVPSHERFMKENSFEWPIRVYGDTKQNIDPYVSVAYSVVSKFLGTKGKVDNIFYNLGAKVVWPTAVIFCGWVYNIAKYKNVKNIYFLSRDGFLFKKIFDVIYKNDKSVKTHSLYVSRRSIAVPYEIANRGNIDLLLYGLDSSKEYDLDTLWSILDINDADVHDKFYNYFYKKSADRSQYNVSDIREFLSIFINDIKEFFRKELNLAYKYVEQEGLFENDSVIVDVGWGGTMQRTLQNISYDQGKDKNIIGAYLGTNETCGLSGENALGFLINKGMLSKHAHLLNIDLIELLFTVPNKSVKKYKEDNNRIVPEFINAGRLENIRIEVSKFVNEAVDEINKFYEDHYTPFNWYPDVNKSTEELFALLLYGWKVSYENKDIFHKIPIIPGHSDKAIWNFNIEKPPEISYTNPPRG